MLLDILMIIIMYLLKDFLMIMIKEIHIRLFAILSTILIIFSLIMIISVRNEFDYYTLILILSYVFFFGQHVLFFINIYPSDMVLLSNYVSRDAMYDTGFLILYSILIMNIGYLLSYIRFNGYRSVTKQNTIFFK